jgi:hypothetical protein
VIGIPVLFPLLTESPSTSLNCGVTEHGLVAVNGVKTGNANALSKKKFGSELAPTSLCTGNVAFRRAFRHSMRCMMVICGEEIAMAGDPCKSFNMQSIQLSHNSQRFSLTRGRQ